jgi:U3 small nucleolar RNA-associated protein 14
MEEDDGGDGNEEKQIRILQETTGMPREAFDGNIFGAYWIIK